MRKKRIGYREPLDEGGINVTPLIDVVFVVLIMFILVAPLLDRDRIDLASAPSSQHDCSANLQDFPIKIYVDAHNTIFYHSQQVSIEQLLECLKAAKKQYPQTTPQLFQDKSAQFGMYQSVKNTVEMAGYDALDVILKG